jgi:CRISPR-associated protein Csx16
MSTIIVSRHPGAVEWVRRRLQLTGPVHVVSHLDDEQRFEPGDRVCGVLPLAAAARICAQGASPWVISVNVPLALRGQELSNRQLDELGARLVEYEVHERSSR